MDHFDYPINDTVSTRVYYSRAGRQVYLVNNKTGEEIAEVKLLGLDLGDFCARLSSGGEDER